MENTFGAGRKSSQSQVIGFEGNLSQFKTVEEVQAMITKLQNVKEDMLRKNTTDSRNGDSGPSFEALPLIDTKGIMFDNEETWLMEGLDSTMGRNNNNVEKQTNYMDSRLLQLRFDLLNSVKQALTEDRIERDNQMSARIKRNTSYIVHRQDESPDKYTPPISKRIQDGATAKGCQTYRVSKNRGSPGRLPVFGQSFEQDTDDSDMPSPIMSSTLNQTFTIERSPYDDKYATVTRSTNLGTTFIASPKEMKHEPHELNVTFIRSSEDEIISSSAENHHSPKNTSMEELQSKARQQEQRLRDTPIRRKDTHVIAYHDVQAAKLTSRTSSTDTYSLAESNPDSGSSSGVSSPRDSQSYENVRLPNAFGRSMPNLVHLQELRHGNPPKLMPKAVHDKSSRYTSDPRLSIARSSTSNNNSTFVRPSKNMPTYSRSDTFQKSRPQVLSIPPQYRQPSKMSVYQLSQMAQSARNAQLGPGSGVNAQRTYEADIGYGDDQHRPKMPSDRQMLSHSRPSFHGSNQADSNNFEAGKTRSSKIPAPGSRIMKHF